MLEGPTYATIRVCNPRNPKRCQTVKGVVVDTGATDTFLPADVLAKVGIKLRKTETARIATGERITYRSGDAVLYVNGRRTTSPVAATQPLAPPRVGVTVLEHVGLKPNPLTHKLEDAEKLA